MSEKTAYEQLKERFALVADLSNAAAILSMDQQVAMPENSADDRTRQLVALSMTCHNLIKDPLVEKLLNEAEAAKNTLTKEDQRNLQLMRRSWIGHAGLPDELVEEMTKLESEGERLHTKNRASGDWSKMKDWYEHSFNIMRAVGLAKKDKVGASSIYEALLSSFTPDISAATVARELGAMEKVLPQLIKDAQQVQAQKQAPIPLTGKFSKKRQEKLCKIVAAAMGFDFKGGNLYVINGHPMSGGTSSDVRFTTDYDEKNFLLSIYSTIHETGHSIYSQNTPQKWRYQPAGEAMGMGVHESQSRIMEVFACGTPEFFQFLEKEARKVFKRPDDPALSAENLERLINKANPSFIRVMADELTYPAHVILRHKLESAIIEGKLEVKDLPEAWNKEMQNLLGITPSNPSEGCMQDVHWPCGAIGYFPSYTLGNMMAAQLFAAANKAHPEIKAELAKGNFAPLKNWLTDNVHSKGSLLTTDELLIAATGETLNAKHYLDHLSQRYTGKPYQPAGSSPAPSAKSGFNKQL